MLACEGRRMKEIALRVWNRFREWNMKPVTKVFIKNGKKVTETTSWAFCRLLPGVTYIVRKTEDL